MQAGSSRTGHLGAAGAAGLMWGGEHQTNSRNVKRNSIHPRSEVYEGNLAHRVVQPQNKGTLCRWRHYAGLV